MDLKAPMKTPPEHGAEQGTEQGPNVDLWNAELAGLEEAAVTPAEREVLARAAEFPDRDAVFVETVFALGDSAEDSGEAMDGLVPVLARARENAWRRVERKRTLRRIVWSAVPVSLALAAAAVLFVTKTVPLGGSEARVSSRVGDEPPPRLTDLAVAAREGLALLEAKRPGRAQVRPGDRARAFLEAARREMASPSVGAVERSAVEDPERRDDKGAG